MSNIARMTVDVPQEFKNEIKSHAALLGIKLKDYVMGALEARLHLDEELEDKYLAKLSDKAKKEGFIGEAKSKALLHKMKNA
jgi:hypothetical protein